MTDMKRMRDIVVNLVNWRLFKVLILHQAYAVIQYYSNHLEIHTLFCDFICENEHRLQFASVRFETLQTFD